MAGAVGSRLADGAALMDGAVQVNDVMVTYLREALLTVSAVQVFYCVMAALWCGAAMDYDFCYLDTVVSVPCVILIQRTDILDKL